jgi:predicted Rossmann-fold nucleotide-binding protein
MAGVSHSFSETPGREGRVIGILPAHPDDPMRTPTGYSNPWVEIAVRTHLAGRGTGGEGPDSRNHLVVLSSDVVVALPGGDGTLSELRLAARYRRPVLLLGWEGEGDRHPGLAPPAFDLPALLTELDRLLAGAEV